MKAVNTRVNNVTVTREGYNMRAKWVVPAEMIDRDNERCAEYVDIKMIFNQEGKKAAQLVEAKKGKEKGVGNPNPGSLDISYTKADIFWIRGQGTGDEVVKNFDRERFYPKTSRKCTNVNVGVWGGNKKGNGIKVWSMYKFGLPRKPKVTWSYSAGTATLTVKTDPGEDKYERYDTRIKIDFCRPGSNKWIAFFPKTDSRYGVFETTSTEYTTTLDLSTYIDELIQYENGGKSLKVRCRAYARGMRGNNPQVDKKDSKGKPIPPVTSILKIAIPNPATVGTIEVDRKNTEDALSETSRIKVPVTVGGNTSHVQLQRRRGENGSWEDVRDAEDNGSCTALYDSYGSALPEPGQYIYYRVESEHLGFRAHSAPKRADCLFTAKPEAQCFASTKILSTSQVQEEFQGSVQVSLKVVMAYTDSNYTNTGCELSWSDHPAAWNSTIAPNTQLFEGDDSASTTAALTKDYAHTKSVWIYGLEPGSTYYIRMRRYRVVDGQNCYSNYDTNIGNRLMVRIEGADAGDTCGIVSTTVGKSSDKIAVTVGITENNDNTGTELSWSTDPDAWRSNEQPSILEATWDLETATGDVATRGWENQQTAYLVDLERGATYYIMARRFLDSTAGRTYGPYSNQVSFTTSESAASASIQCNLLSVEPDGGTGAVAVVGWDGDHTGCEVTWSKDPNAWESSTRPQSFEFEWQDAGNKSGFKTEDTEIVASKTYYTRTELEGGGYAYTKVESPVASDLDSYYELAWSHTSTCYISDLEEGETYYVKARSYYDGGGDRAWSDYSEPLTVIPYAAPNSVVLDAPDAVARGEAIELFWSIDSEIEQVDWHVHEEDKPRVSLADGAGSLCRASIPAERYGDAATVSIYVEVSCGGGYTSSNVETVAIVQRPTCVASIAPVLTAQPASFEVYANGADASVLATCRSEGITMTLPDGEVEQVDGDVVWTASATPAFTETTWGETTYRQRLADAVTAAQTEVAAIEAEIDEMEADDPKRVIAQNSLDAANSRLAAAQAAKQADLDERPSDETVYVATVEIPVIDLYDGGNYVVSVQAVESIAGLASDAVELPFAVDYAHKAADPSADITVVPNVAERAVRVNLVADYEMVLTEDTTVDPSKTYYDLAPDMVGYEGPQYRVVEDPQDELVSGYLENVPEVLGDVYDVYRKTQDGYDLIASNVPLDGDVYDTFAPYGNVELAYRVCTRTVDGSIAFRDFPYEMDVRGTRFDWDNRSVELPWNVETRDSYAKSFEARAHADGSVNGYYDRAVTRTGSLSTDTVKVREQGTLELVRALGNYAGACFCRTDKGAAFQCNAELSEVGISYDSGAVPVRFELTKMDLSQEFMVKDEEDVDNG